MRKNITQIVEDIKKLKGFTTDSDVGRVLGLKSAALYNHKTRGSIPFDAIATFCEQEQASLDWLVFGKGEPYIKEGTESEAVTAETPGDNEFAELLKMSKEVLKSGTDFSEALSANIRSSYRAVELEKSANTAPKKATHPAENINTLTERVKTLEEHLVKYEDTLEKYNLILNHVGNKNKELEYQLERVTNRPLPQMSQKKKVNGTE